MGGENDGVTGRAVDEDGKDGFVEGGGGIGVVGTAVNGA